ncbi:hypothetical protein TrVFT333_008143 [Trichoderma virens FT-333]|nr:hypothetical protein TrVFT333_008143 [Trichoderma virens FT-333]
MSKTTVTTTETILLQPLSPPAPIASISRRSSDPDLLAPITEHSVHDAESALPPETAVSTAQRWNDPPRNKYRVLSCFFAFLVYGMNDGAPGAMVPLFGEYYHLSHSIVSLIFLSPMISRIATKVEDWWIFYCLMTGLACLACVGVTSSFWDDTGSGFHRQHASPSPNAQEGTIKILKNRVTLTLSAFMVLYAGSEVTIGGWLLTFMMSVRNGSPTASSLATSGYWVGLTAGRFGLGWITGHVGEKVMVTVYLLSAIGLEIGFWLGKEFAVSAVMAALIGVSTGMIMPSGIRVMTKLLPPEKHLVSVGFATAFAVSGSSVFPFAVGALAEAYGVQVLQPVALALFGSQLALWLFISRGKLKV